ncbi:MAG TPA: bifunctional riboflavin kinase/FAD synthetase [Candidatus Limnocylindria bacterium]|nr:bifunctional riboflavin kinase/FAD synthetase [Candidatus Limnocylindria bacterium]
MRVIRHLERGAVPPADVVLTLGNFDGVHVGHAAIIRRARAEATARGAALVVLTFHPHPATVLAPAKAPARLQALHERLVCVAGLGVDVAVVQRFTPAFAHLEAEDFVREYLCRWLCVRHVVVGHRVSFGRGRVGSAALLERLGASLGFTVESLGPVQVDGEEVSSTSVRTAVSAADMARAARLLGRAYGLRGRVVTGDRLGHTIGFPTANLHVPGGVLLPPDGVYAAWTEVAGTRHRVALNIGVRPTFAGRRRTVEAYLLDFDGDLYGAWLRLELVARLRGEERFADIAALKRAIARDVAQARAVLDAAPAGRA